MQHAHDRREFLKRSVQVTAGASLLSVLGDRVRAADKKPLFRISLAQWSLHHAFFDGKLDNLDFAKMARREYGIEAIEYVNQFFKDKAKDKAYLAEMKQRAADRRRQELLIMSDGEGNLGDPERAERTKAVENHYKWVEAAKFLGCHSIRVNARQQRELSGATRTGRRRTAAFSEFAAISTIST